MSHLTAIPQQRDRVSFFAPAWGEAQTAVNADALRSMESYIRRAGRGQGLDDDEMSDDLNEKFNSLGSITVSRTVFPMGIAFTVDITNGKA